MADALQSRIGSLRPSAPGAGAAAWQALVRLLQTGWIAVLCACAGVPAQPVHPSDQASAPTTVDMLVATTRAPAGPSGADFTGERGHAMSLANVVVSLPPGRQVGTVQWPRSLPGDPQRSFAIQSAEPLQRNAVTTWFSRVANNKRRVLVFVHGFNTQFDAALFRFAQIAHDTNSGAAPLLFTWPSRGRLLHYNYDKESANFSRSYLADVLLQAAATPQVSEITILAHSMGAWIAMEALQQIALERHGIPEKFNNVILASPDIDVDVFRRQLEDIGPRRPLITVFVSGRDRALGISSALAGGVTRVGSIDVNSRDYQADFANVPKLVFIDTSQVDSGGLNHNTFATSPRIVQLIGERLIAGQAITDGDGASPSDAAASLGTAARTLVSTPFLILNHASAAAH